jgi:phage terminase large subunit
MTDVAQPSAQEQREANLRAAAQLRRWRNSPLTMVREEFKVEPDPWQADVLEQFPHNPYVALTACKGPGKTCVLAWLNWNFLVTRPFPKMAATSISGDNLRDNLWAEMAKWRDKSPMIKAEFEWTKQRIYNRKAEETWFLSARTWPQSADPQKQADTLAGLHADYIMFTLDESGGIPDAVMVAAEAALSSCIEGHILQAGNPTQLAGPLYRANRTRKENGGRWLVINITGDPDDPKRSPRVSVQWAKDQIETHGRDNPWVLVNVFGQFPPSSFNSLIGVDEVRAAMKRMYREWDYQGAARVLGVDVARYGNAASVIYKRQGLQSFPMKKVRGINSVQGAGLVSRVWDEWGADTAFVDATGGFGAGWIDQLVQIGKAPIGIQFSSQAHENTKYANKRAEMYFDAVEWIKRGGALPESEELLRTLTETTYTFQKDRILLEPKEDIEARLGFTLDEADGFVLTFAEPVSPKGRAAGKPRHQFQHDPFSDQNMGLASAIEASYDPFAR